MNGSDDNTLGDEVQWLEPNLSSCCYGDGDRDASSSSGPTVKSQKVVDESYAVTLLPCPCLWAPYAKMNFLLTRRIFQPCDKPLDSRKPITKIVSL